MNKTHASASAGMQDAVALAPLARLSSWHLLLFVMAGMALAFGIAAAGRPEVYWRYIEGVLFFDEVHYLDLAWEGVPPEGSAFHPLYAWLVGGIENHLPYILLPTELALIARGLSTVLFGVTVFVFARLLRGLVSWPSAALATLLFGLNPFSVFHGLAYTESLFSLLSLGLFAGILRGVRSGFQKSTNVLIIASAGLMALCRPSYFVVLAVALGCVAVIALAPVLKVQLEPEQRRRFLRGLGLTALATGLFTLGYFFYLDIVTGSPWSSLEAQRNFDRTLGFYWQHFLTPNTLNGSDNIFVWEIQAFWLPMIMAGLFLLYKPWQQTLKGAGYYAFWFATFFVGAHIAANLFTHPKFYSLGRHVMAQPFFFILIAFTLDRLPNRRWLRNALWFYLFASFVYLAMNWARFGDGSWVG